jgi:predicted DNA-binding transcriptional regulator AlpA
MELITLQEFRERLKISRSTFWDLERTDPTFPKAVQITKRRKAYVMSEVDAWFQAKMDERGEVA